jgi:hypothetical protein
MPRHLVGSVRQRERCAGRRSRPRVFAGMSVKRTRSSAVALRDSPIDFNPSKIP